MKSSYFSEVVLCPQISRIKTFLVLFFLMWLPSNFLFRVYKESPSALSLWLCWCKFPEGASRMIHPQSLNHPSHNSFINSLSSTQFPECWGDWRGRVGTPGEFIARESLACGCAAKLIFHHQTFWSCITLNSLVNPAKRQKGITNFNALLLGEFYSWLLSSSDLLKILYIEVKRTQFLKALFSFSMF